MRPLPFSEFRSDVGIRWPRFEPDWRRTRVSFVLALLLTFLGSILFSAVAEGATFSGAGQTCALTAAHEPTRGPVVVQACATVYACAPAGGSYTTGAVLMLPSCSVDRVFASHFDGVTP